MDTNQQLSAARDPGGTGLLTKQDFLDILGSSHFDKAVHRAVSPILKEISEEFKSMKLLINQQQQQLTTLKSTVKAQQEQINSLLAQRQTAEKQDRLRNLKVTGLVCNKDDTHQAIIKLINDELGIGLQQSEITTRVILPRKPKQEDWPKLNKAATPVANSNDPVTVTALVTFNNIWRRREVYGRKGLLSKTKVYISEDLPKEESRLLFECRKLRRAHLI